MDDSRVNRLLLAAEVRRIAVAIRQSEYNTDGNKAELNGWIANHPLDMYFARALDELRRIEALIVMG